MAFGGITAVAFMASMQSRRLAASNALSATTAPTFSMPSMRLAASGYPVDVTWENMPEVELEKWPEGGQEKNGK